MGKRSLFWHLLIPYVAITVMALLVLCWYASRTLRSFHMESVASDLLARARLVADQATPLLQNGPHEDLDVLCKRLGAVTETRLTVVLEDGVVIGDSDDNPAAMDNHADRPEIAAALRSEPGQTTRFSTTRRQNTMYVAVPLVVTNHIIGVARASIPLTRLEDSLSRILLRIILGGMVTAVAAVLLSLVVARQISGPLQQMREAAEHFARGDFGVRVPPVGSAEIGELADSMNWMAAQLDEKIQTIRHHQNEQQAVFASMVEGVLAVDAREHVLNINRAAADLLSVNTATAVGRSIQEVIRNPDLQQFVRRALASPAPIAGEIILQDTEERFLQAHGTVLQDAVNPGALIVLHDITHLRHLESVRRDFVANVSHELRTPITSIKGFVETMMAETPADGSQFRHFLEIIMRQADRLHAIIEDLLSLSRIERETERGEIVLETGRIQPILEAAVLTCRGQADEKQVSLSVNGPADLAAAVNKDLIEQAVVNLLDNAIKYTDPGKRIDVAAAGTPAEVAITVRDEGCGIPEEHLSRVFERFYRVDKARSRKLGGTGLGLAIVKHIAQAHGGSVSVESAVGRGSTFTIRLPRR